MPFPVHGLLPKTETQTLRFLAAHARYDGRGTVVAVLDTGVDPGAPGLQTCPDGSPKIVDIVDCTGAGDVLCTHTARATTAADGTATIRGVSGRMLVLGCWQNPSGLFRLGVKHSLAVFPQPLVARLAAEARRVFATAHHRLVKESLEKESLGKESLEQEKESLEKESQEQEKESQEQEKESLEQEKESLEKESLESTSEHRARTEGLHEQLKGYKDPGTLMDCVVFNDGTKWRAVIDFNGSGNLAQSTPMTNYRDERQHVCIDTLSMLNVSVNIYDEGEMLSIVTTAGSHGTHVAAITAAYHPDAPELNGVAPGAQIVSLKIGDTRLGSMETGTALVRAAIELTRNNIDLANISYGEASALPNFGTFIDLLKKEVINEAGCIVVSSAGNNGPALTTVGAPGGSTTEVISVGAYVSESMMSAEYSLLKNVPERPYTWSSRGPTSDGDQGVDIYAPGAAITSVPQFTIQHSQLMNGTSMSSPNCCGCLALLLSGLKQESIPYSPYLIRRAIQTSAKSIKDSMNVGLIQVEDAWKYLTANKGTLTHSLHYEVSVPSRNNARGIYLREPVETANLLHTSVNILPLFPKSNSHSQNITKLGYEVQVALESTHDWIKIPEFMILDNAGRSISVRVDPTELKEGLHVGSINGYDSNNRKSGPIFNIPITICKPRASTEEASYIKLDCLNFSPGDINRNFICVPSGASFVEIEVSCADRKTPAQFILHTVQLQTDSRYTTFEHHKNITLGSHGSGVAGEERSYKKLNFPVLPNVTLEVFSDLIQLCLAQFWSSLESSKVTISLKFHGIQCSVSSGASASYGAVGSSGGCDLLINAGINGHSRIDVYSGLRLENFVPKITFGTDFSNSDQLSKVYRPTEESFIRPLKSRDVLPDGRQAHELQLTYKLEIMESSTVLPKFPRFNNVLYDSSFVNFGLYVFDSNKKAISFQDIYRKPIKLSEGEYTFVAQLVHHDVPTLMQLKGMNMVLETTLSKPVSPPLFKKFSDTLDPAAKFYKSSMLGRGDRSVFFVGDLPAGSLPKEARPGDTLTGELCITLDETKIEGKLFTVTYIVPPEFKDKKGDSVVDKIAIKEPSEKLKEEIRDLEISYLKKMDFGQHNLHFCRLEEKYRGNLQVYRTSLEFLVEKIGKPDADSSAVYAALESVSRKVLGLIDEGWVAQYFGVERDPNDASERNKTERVENELKRTCLSLCYESQCTLEVYRRSLINDPNLPDFKSKSFDALLLKFMRFTPDAISKPNYLRLWIMQQRGLKNYAKCIAAISKFESDPKSKKTSAIYRIICDEKVQIMKLLGWDLWVDYEAKHNLMRFPAERQTF